MVSASLLVFYLGLLAAGVMGDITRRRVPNWLVLALLATAVVGSFVGVSAAVTPLRALTGASIGLGMWLPFWIAGLLGAGDVKFFAAGAAWIGPSLSWRATLIAALLGGVMSLGVMVWRLGVKGAAESVVVQTVNAKQLIATADVAGQEAASRTFPYALPMAVSLAAASLFPEHVLALLGS